MKCSVIKEKPQINNLACLIKFVTLFHRNQVVNSPLFRCPSPLVSGFGWSANAVQSWSDASGTKPSAFRPSTPESSAAGRRHSGAQWQHSKLEVRVMFEPFLLFSPFLFKKREQKHILNTYRMYVVIFDQHLCSVHAKRQLKKAFLPFLH